MGSAQRAGGREGRQPHSRQSATRPRSRVRGHMEPQCAESSICVCGFTHRAHTTSSPGARARSSGTGPSVGTALPLARADRRGAQNTTRCSRTKSGAAAEHCAGAAARAPLRCVYISDVARDNPTAGRARTRWGGAGGRRARSKAERSGAEEERRGRTCSTLRETACPMIIGSKLRSCRCDTAACAPLMS